MGKYESLGQFLRRQKAERIPMTFAEIERIIGAKLPASKKQRAWWSNNPDNNVMTRIWIEAGFETENVNPQSGRLVFHRKPKSPRKTRNAKANWESVFGSMKGMITFSSGFDAAASPYSEFEWEEIEREWSNNWDQLMRG